MPLTALLFENVGSPQVGAVSLLSMRRFPVGEKTVGLCRSRNDLWLKGRATQDSRRGTLNTSNSTHVRLLLNTFLENATPTMCQEFIVVYAKFNCQLSHTHFCNPYFTSAKDIPCPKQVNTHRSLQDTSCRKINRSECQQRATNCLQTARGNGDAIHEDSPADWKGM